MTVTASDHRALATWLSDLDDRALATLLARRGTPPNAPWRDTFDAAAALLEPASVERALAGLTREALSRLAGEHPPDPDLIALALTAPDGRPYDVVVRLLTAIGAADVSPDDTPWVHEPPAPAGAATEAVLAERAFTATAALGELLTTTITAPILRTGAGAISAADRRRLQEIGVAEDPDAMTDAIAAAVSAGLLASEGREWMATANAAEWLDLETLARWSTVMHRFRDTLPIGLRSVSGEIMPPSGWSVAYPLDPQWPERARALLRIATRWGLFADDGSEPTWTTPLRAGGDLDVEALRVHLPGEIDNVYLQADLTAIAPGPLRAPLDRRLRRIAVRESHAQASTYRFTDESVTRGISEGETAASIREFLGELSLTGIPQPLEYLVERNASRHGLVRVVEGERTRVTSPDAHLLETIRVDQSLRHLGFIPTPDDLESRATADAVYWALVDARYPVIRIGADGRASHPHRRRPTQVPVATDAADAYAPLIAALRASSATETETAWLERELDRAVRTRAVIVVEVRLPNGSTREFTLEATGTGGGRLRGRDRAADVERTVPITSIASVRAVPAPGG